MSCQTFKIYLQTKKSNTQTIPDNLLGLDSVANSSLLYRVQTIKLALSIAKLCFITSCHFAMPIVGYEVCSIQCDQKLHVLVLKCLGASAISGCCPLLVKRYYYLQYYHKMYIEEVWDWRKFFVNSTIWYQQKPVVKISEETSEYIPFYGPLTSQWKRNCRREQWQNPCPVKFPNRRSHFLIG